MTTSYPAGLDSYTNPTATDELDDEIGTRTHSEFHADNNDAIEAIQTELGTTPKGAAANVGARIAATETVANAALPTATAATTYQPLDTDLTAIAALTSAADKVPYSTGAGTWALTDFSVFGRTLVDDADASTARSTLGLGTMAVATATDYVAKSLFDANTVLYATTDNTPVALTVGASTIVGRKATGDISALTVAESKTLLAIDHGADLAGLSDDDHAQYVLTAGTRSTAQVVLQAGNAAHIPLIARGAAAQSGNLQQWQNDIGTVLSAVTGNGYIGIGTSAPSRLLTAFDVVYPSNLQIRVGYSDSYMWEFGRDNATGKFHLADESGTKMTVLNDGSFGFGETSPAARVHVKSVGAATPVIIAKGAAAQSGNLQEWQNSSGTVLASVTSAGGFQATNGYFNYLIDLSYGGPYIQMESTAVTITNRTTATNVPLAVKGMAAQSGNLQQWLDSSSAAVASVASDGLSYFNGVNIFTSAGRLQFGHADQAQTTVGAAGGASALPATPTKYFKVKDSGGTEYVIPAYAAA